MLAELFSVPDPGVLETFPWMFAPRRAGRARVILEHPSLSRGDGPVLALQGDGSWHGMAQKRGHPNTNKCKTRSTPPKTANIITEEPKGHVGERNHYI